MGVVNVEGGNRLQGVQLLVRLVCLVILVVLVTVHVRSLRVFRWEQSVSGGLFVTYTLAVLGLALEAGLELQGAKAFQVYICASGSMLMAINAGAIYRRWRGSTQLARVVAELLGALGVPLRKQIYMKVALSAAAAVVLIVDLFLTMLTGKLY